MSENRYKIMTADPKFLLPEIILCDAYEIKDGVLYWFKALKKGTLDFPYFIKMEFVKAILPNV